MRPYPTCIDRITSGRSEAVLALPLTVTHDAMAFAAAGHTQFQYATLMGMDAASGGGTPTRKAVLIAIPIRIVTKAVNGFAMNRIGIQAEKYFKWFGGTLDWACALMGRPPEKVRLAEKDQSHCRGGGP